MKRSEPIDEIYKSHNALVSHPTMHNSEQKCHISVWIAVLWDILQVYCGIWEIGLFELCLMKVGIGCFFFKKLRFLVWSASNIKTQTLINIRETNMMQSLIHIPISMVVKLGRMWVIISNKNNGCSFISMLKSQLVCVSAIVPRREIFMMTSSNGNFFRATSHLCRESTGHRWIPRPKASDAGLWNFLWSAPEWRLSKQSWGWWFETPSRLLWRHSNV